jgi:hypothetical protein
MTVNTQNGSDLSFLRGLRAAALAAVAALLVACGGDSDCTAPPAFEGSTEVGECNGGGDPAAPTAADLSLTLSAPSLANDGTSTITATATAVNANANTVPDIPITISVNNSAQATVSGAATDDKGVVSAAIGIGADRANRTVTVTAISGGLSRTATFQVVGSNLTSTPLPAVIAPGVAGQVDFRLVDVNSNPMSGQNIVVNGVNAVEVTGTTDSNGSYSYAYTAPATGGSLDIRATAGGASVTQTVLVQSGTGTIPPASVPGVPGVAVVQSASLAASPSVVPVNTGSTSNRSELRALFLGAGNASVKNVRVRFDLAGDANSIGGSLTSGTNVVYSDSNGVATTAYMPGSRFSPTDGLTVRACWSVNDFPAKAANAPDPTVGSPECPNATTATLTVISEALSVSIGTDALIEVSGQSYVKRYVVQVVDSSGLAKAGVQISPSIDLVQYFKGAWEPEGTTKWVQRVPLDPSGTGQDPDGNGTCDNEDLNRNGVLQVYPKDTFADPKPSRDQIEDANNTGFLEPRKADVAISFVGESSTNSDGQVVLKITYPQSIASWVSFNIQVAASGVAGTEGRTNYSGVLPVLAEAITDVKKAPAFSIGPYGVYASPTVATTTPERQTGLLCTNPN